MIGIQNIAAVGLIRQDNAAIIIPQMEDLIKIHISLNDIVIDTYL